ncbi:dihydrolipoamide acetyltransferase family protein [Portibacter lacus]|uniref:Dihydrolipoamide acetyltransferase component of pyruvate dehydrogenase complex n=1 Tax=Portibacter lacus TaxID=1099794 RepID=A0AA37SS93_9BACT|nr:dihydrolipoamide acetyltransferase family protein [Portibacter lacus]GLR18544.1 dihydrolipoamide acetyltransferase component of pyruvate dehydrogenase complex [Portibacter lacus]
MAIVDLVMPKMGESIMEATILKWLKKEGDTVELDESILEIATDKVDSDIPSPVEGVISEILFIENEIVEVGKVIARIKTDATQEVKPSPAVPEEPINPEKELKSTHQNGHAHVQETILKEQPKVSHKSDYQPSTTDRFYSPLVRTIAQRESISIQELDQVPGSGANGRVTKKDILNYLEQKDSKPSAPQVQQEPETIKNTPKVESPSNVAAKTTSPSPSPSLNGGTEIIEMDRMRKLIADHMVKSKQSAPHVTSFVEVDVTNVVQWREKVKAEFQKKHGEKITFTPIFMEAVTKAIKDYPMVNISLEGDKIIKKNFINLGMAAALPSGNLIVPVIKNADHLNLLGLTKAVNDLAKRARENNLKADEIQGGTFTLTNVGTFGNVMGTPIINQPQVAILAVGAIKKKPAVIETEMGDLIAIRHMMFLSLSYDHRIVDGFLGGSFLRKIADYLEAFDKDRNI